VARRFVLARVISAAVFGAERARWGFEGISCGACGLGAGNTQGIALESAASNEHFGTIRGLAAFTVTPLLNVNGSVLLRLVKVRAMLCLPSLLSHQRLCLSVKTAP
jgi:hypothetical protein